MPAALPTSRIHAMVKPNSRSVPIIQTATFTSMQTASLMPHSSATAATLVVLNESPYGVWVLGFKATVRFNMLKCDSHTCCICRKHCTIDISHVVPKSLGGGEWNPDNIQVLCRECHETKALRDNNLFFGVSQDRRHAPHRGLDMMSSRRIFGR